MILSLKRLDEDDRREYLPRIPVQPVGYTDVEQLLLRMEGDAAPEDWQGGLNLVYRLSTCPPYIRCSGMIASPGWVASWWTSSTEEQLQSR